MAGIRFLGCDQDAFCASVARHVGEFEEASGHQVNVQLVDNDDYFTNELAPYLEGEDPADVYMSGPVLMWEHLGAGRVEPLDAFLEHATSGYDPEDFLTTLIGCNRWSGRFGDPLGEGPLLEIPVNCESYNLAYLPAALERAGAEVPTTWEGYFAVARQIADRAAPCRGFGQRGVDVWHTVYTGFASQLWSYGGRDFDESSTCAIASPPALSATSDILSALRDAGPVDWPNQRWYELAIDFANGNYGLIVDSDHYVAYFENPDVSTVSGKVGYALPPLGPSGVRSSNLWTWSLVMNANSSDKKTSWEFMEWASGKAFLLRSAFEGNMNPTRKSVWADARFRERASGWGDFAAVASKLIDDVADVLVTPAVNYIDIARRWTRALRDAYADIDSLESCLTKAAAEIDELVAR